MCIRVAGWVCTVTPRALRARVEFDMGEVGRMLDENVPLHLARYGKVLIICTRMNNYDAQFQASKNKCPLVEGPEHPTYKMFSCWPQTANIRATSGTNVPKETRYTSPLNAISSLALHVRDL